MKLFVTLLLFLFESFYSVPAFAQYPPLILTGRGGGGGTSTGGRNQPSTKPTLKVNEPQYSILPATTFSNEEAATLVELEKKLKVERLANASRVLGSGPDVEIKENRTKGLARWHIMDGMTTSEKRSQGARPPISAVNSSLPDSYDQSAVAGDGSKPRSAYRSIEIPGMEKFQAANREAQQKPFSELMLAIAGDPTTAAAVGTDVIVGGVARPFVNAAGKVGEEMVRQVQCASLGQLASSGCGEVTPWQDYWGTLMRGEGEGYTAGALALDAITLGAGRTIAGLGSEAALAILKKVPEGLETLAKGIGHGIERMKAGYASSGFADEAGQLLIKEGERIGSTSRAEAALTKSAIENATTSINKSTQNSLINGDIPGVTFDGQIFRSGSWDIHPGNINANHRYSKVGTGALYTAMNGETVVAEVRFYVGADAVVSPLSKFTKVDRMLDLTKPEIRASLGLSLDDITSDSYAITHAIGDLARLNYNGIIAPSARLPDGINIVFFQRPDFR